MPAPESPPRSRPWLWLLLALGASVAILKWNIPSDEQVSVVRRPPATAAPEALSETGPPSPRKRALPALATPAPAITPAAAVPVEEDLESRCWPITTFGRCDGDVAKACVANKVVTIDCATNGLRCAITDEGVQCLARTINGQPGCSGKEVARCDGNTLLQCVNGAWAHIDCAARKASCEITQAGARCSGTLDIAKRTTIEVCDGRDNDGDARVDEGSVCDPVNLVAFVADGYKPLNLEARMQNELAILNRVFKPTVFQWAKTLSVDEQYAQFAPRLLPTTASKLGRGQLDGFYIAVLYVDELHMQPPKAGISTLPNARCGGVRVSDSPSPPEGVIVLTEDRQPETLTHEMGHYLGLCHTHYDVSRFTVSDAEGSECTSSGDGICDTLTDPGPEHCARGPSCTLDCGSASLPDPTNIMSYYIGCRRIMTSEQVAEAQRNLSLRRGWFPCLDPKACVCQPGVAGTCPSEMSCEPGYTIDGPWSCALDGAALPGGVCRDPSECSAGAFCLQQGRGAHSAARCVRPCHAGDPCSCVEVGLPFRICSDDLPQALDVQR